MSGQSGIGTEQFRGEAFNSTLFRRLVRPSRQPYSQFFHIFVLIDGRAVVEFADENHVLSEQAAFTFPASTAPTLSIDPGAEALLVGLSQELLVDAIGNKADSVLLRTFAERPAIATLDGTSAEVFGDLIHLTRGFLKEVMVPGRGSDLAIAGYARLLLMTLWRTGDWEKPASTGHGLDVGILQRFRQLVELHFRERRPIAFYAKALGLSHDRLHAICTRTLERTPKALIQQRLMQEANLRLERSASSIQEIAAQLGFADQTYFSHAYKRVTGISPHEYRQRVMAPEARARRAVHAEYSDWP
ncbi:MAG TPA: AraC family transcriptional regulator [Ensifer sp.]|nr:AraC family transcriptional regulator [Ensifer sp.]